MTGIILMTMCVGQVAGVKPPEDLQKQQARMILQQRAFLKGQARFNRIMARRYGYPRTGYNNCSRSRYQQMYNRYNPYQQWLRGVDNWYRNYNRNVQRLR